MEDVFKVFLRQRSDEAFLNPLRAFDAVVEPHVYNSKQSPSVNYMDSFLNYFLFIVDIRGFKEMRENKRCEGRRV